MNKENSKQKGLDEDAVLAELFSGEPHLIEKAKEILGELKKIRRKKGMMYKNFIKKFKEKGESAKIIYKLENIRAVRFYRECFGAKMIRFFPDEINKWYKNKLISQRDALLKRIEEVVSEQTFSCPVCKKMFPMRIAEEVSFRCCSLLAPINGEQISEVIKKISELNSKIELL